MQLDIDTFKGVKKHFGHEAGTKFLKSWLERLKNSLRLTDTNCELGGDEFGRTNLRHERVQS